MEEITLQADFEIEYAKTKGSLVEPRQHGVRIYRAGKITAYSDVFVAIEGKKFLRSVNEFVVIE
ncbi:hypothetical protein ACFFK0_11515 [Paenibacillus chartarius]|uniref:Uncharacterized protein n=1 Tax=Paenibacillus chartarius TaxID=747481 RepID=A0ABV6DKB3_9BACL